MSDLSSIIYSFTLQVICSYRQQLLWQSPRGPIVVGMKKQQCFCQSAHGERRHLLHYPQMRHSGVVFFLSSPASNDKSPKATHQPFFCTLITFSIPPFLHFPIILLAVGSLITADYVSMSRQNAQGLISQDKQ